MIIPPLFICPISLDLLRDPVTLCTGQTYDRSSIEKWLAAGNLTCPVTMQKLHDPSIIPNHTLRHLIDQWLNSGTQIDPVYLKIVDGDSSIAAIKHNLESNESTLENKLEILEIIHALADELPLQNSCLIQLDFFCLLLQVVFRNSEGQHDYKEKLMSFGGRLIAKGSETKELCIKLGKSVNLLQEIIHLVRNNSEAAAVAEAGIKAISALSSMESNRENLVKEGASRRTRGTYFQVQQTRKKLSADGSVHNRESFNLRVRETGDYESPFWCKCISQVGFQSIRS
ncbi:U-box domain-containing protein 26-like [Forsythia ovata]|uniref:U-box domain-containing protein n=1 Tax=Forsythia ovata TaxID=205694 RepID=A0ABD1U8F3_9LAMI